VFSEAAVAVTEAKPVDPEFVSAAVYVNCHSVKVI
jgi:hypothetical protein